MSSRSGLKIQSDARSQISTAHDHDVELIHGDDVQLEDLTVQSHGDVQLEDLILGSGPTRGGGQEDATTPGAGDVIRTMILEESKTGKYKKYEDMLLGDISKQEKKHPVICLLDMTLDEKLTTEFSSSPRPTPVKSLGEIATSPFTVPGLSDGGAVQFDDKFPQDDDVQDVSVSGSLVHEDVPVITKDEFLEKMTRVNEFLEMSQNEQLDLEQMRQIFEVEVEAIADPGGRR